MQMNTAVTRSQEAILQTNKVIRNTYILLSMTLIFSAFTAFLGVVSGIGHGAALVADIVAIAILWFVLPRTANSAAGIPTIFAFTGLLGFGLGPVLNYYLSVNPSIVMTALGYAMWYHLIVEYGVNQVMPFLLLLPVTSVAGGMLFLGETLTLKIAAGGALAITGVGIITIRRRRLQATDRSRA